jgi:photosystem II stability/assembly factor-like uncharacterized protein
MPETQNLDGLLRWRCIGPFRGGRVVAVAGSYHDPATFYFGAVCGGVWKTTDAGTYWKCVSDGFFNTSAVGALAVAPSDSNVLYAGTGETTIRIDVSHGDGLYKSTDAGTTWEHVGLKDTRHIGKIRVHPDNPDIVWVAALGHAFGKNKERGVFKSTDGGKNWQNVLFVSDKAGAVDLTLDANPRILYASIWEAHRSFWYLNSGGEDSGLWISKDGGETWSNITTKPGMPKGTIGKIGVSASPAKSGRVWAVVEHTTEGGIYRSDDYGENWTRVSDNQNLVSRSWYFNHITADPQDAETVYVNNLSFYRSTDGGKNFTELGTPHGDNHDMWIDPKNNKRMIQGNDGGANVSLNGALSFSTVYNQPTMQFYHIAVDTREPYYVYGTQQDNSSIAVPSRGGSHSAITWQDCYIAGTGESGYIAVRPDNPDIVYVGAIGSSPGGGNCLQRYDHKTKQIRLITTWPEAMSGYGASEHKYRFAWTYPIVISPHDPNTLYIGGNIVFKTTDEGQTWATISPDLTRADPETLKPTGGPVNKDSIGAEIYATVFSFAESPIRKGLLWAGSDDGLIHISRDSGVNWQNITPKDLPEWSLVSCIEPSPFDAGTAYVAATRYKLDDYQPYLYVTRDFGESWQRLNNGIPADAFTRVIRTDPACKGLLFAGTETGAYVSFNDGASWQPLQFNLPVSPVHDLIVKDTDLVAGTHGRSIWILDDISPLREIVGGLPNLPAHLFTPRETKRILPGIEWGSGIPDSVNYINSRSGGYLVSTTPEGENVRTYLDVGEPPPTGAVITYCLSEVPTEPLTLTFKNKDGAEIRSYTSRKQDDPPIAKELRAPAKVGWNRFAWNLRHAPVTKIEGKDPAAENTIEGAYIVPGSYSVALKIGENELTREFDVVKPSNLPASQADLEAQYDLMKRIYAQLDRTAKTINSMRSLRGQLDGWVKRTEGKEELKEVGSAAKALSEKVLEVEKTLLVPDLRPGFHDNINNGIRLFEKLAALTPAVGLGDYRPTAAAEEAFTDFTGRIEPQIAAFEKLVAEDLAEFNKAASKAKLGVVFV